MSNDISELRTHLFDTIRGLKDGTLDVEKAKAINETAQTIVNSAKVEVDYLRATDGKDSPFLGAKQLSGPDTPSPVRIVQHRIK